MALLGIDVGSTTLKAGLYAEDGDLLALASREWGCGRSFHPDELWSGLRSVIAEVATGRPPVRAVAISSHGESVVPLDAAGLPLTSFIVNTDCRGEEESRSFARRFGERTLFRRTGLPPHPMYSLVKIARFRIDDPETFARARAFRCVEDWILERAGVGAFVSWSLASRTLGLDLETGAWDADLVRHAGIEPEMLSRPVPSGTALGRAHADAAAELGLPANAVWVAGGHDQGCCSLGSGGWEEGTAVDGTGTFECVSSPVSRPLLSDAALRLNFPTERHTAPGLFLTLAYIPGGIALKWFRDTLESGLVERATADGVDSYDLMLRDAPEEPTDLIVFPHVIGSGTPWLDSNAKGAVIGITTATTHAELVKAVLEGVTLEMAWNLSLLSALGVRLDRVHATGGGARSETWARLKADVFGRPVTVIPGETSCAGAAMLAGMGVGLFKTAAEAGAALTRPGRLFEPNPRRHALYLEKLERHRDFAARLHGHVADPATVTRTGL